MATQTWNLYTGTGAESNRSDSLLMKAVATFNPDYSTTVARLSVTYTITKTSSTGMTSPGTRYGILTKGTEINSSGQITTRGSLLKASSALASITDLSKGGSITKTVIFDFTKGSSEVTYSGVTFLINDNNTSINRSADSTYQWTGEKGSTVSSLPSRFAVISFTVPVGYTNVLNPAANSIKFNDSTTTPLIVTPNANITVSWTAGTAGTNNAIKQYQVTLNGTTKTTTTTSVTFSNLNLGRGRSYKATVKSIPTISGFGPTTGVESTNQVKGNNPPDAPTVTLTGGDTISGVYYIKTGDSVTFSLSSTDAEGHTKTYYRNNINSISGATAIEGTSWSTSTGGTYFFWAKDSLGEYSSVSSKSFTVGATLAGSMGDTTSTTTYSHDNNGTTITYTTGGTNTVNLTSGSKGVGTITYSWSLVCGSDTKPLKTENTAEHTSPNVCTWQYPGDYGWNKTYSIKCEVSDQLSQSFIVTSSTYIIPAKPTFNSNIYNQLGTNVSTMPNGNVSDSIANNFYQTMVTSLTKDTSISLTFSLTPTAEVGWYSGASDETYKNSGVIPLTISGASRDTSYTLRIIATPAWGNSNSFYKDYTIKRAGEPKVQIGTTIENFSSDDITLHGTKVKPFTSTANLNFSFKLGLTGYNFTKDALEEADVFLVANSAKVRIKEKESTNRATIDGVRYIYTQQGGGSANSGLYNWSTNATTLQLNMNSDTNPVSFRIEFTNVFGETFDYTKSGLNFDFVEDPSVSFTIGSNTGSTQGITYIKEGDTITYTPNVTFYNTDKAVTINTYIYRSTSASSQTGGKWELYNGINSNNGVTYTPSRGTSTASAIVYNTPIPYTVGEITDSRYLFFKIRVTYGSTTTDSQIPTTYYVSQRHKSITLPFTRTFSNSNFSYTSSLTDRGGGLITINSSDTTGGLNTGTVKYGLQFNETNDFSIIKTQDTTPIPNKKYYYINNGVYVEFEGETFVQNVEYYEITYQWLDPSGSLVTSINPIWREESSSGGAASYSGSNINLGSGWSFYNIRAVYQTNIGSVTKTSYSSVETIYSISPTVSYRQNKIGININNIEESPEVAVAIGATTVEEIDVKYIKLYGAHNTATIDLDTGNLENFKVNNNNIMSSNTSSRIFVQSSQPSSGMSTGDIWIDISNLT